MDFFENALSLPIIAAPCNMLNKGGLACKVISLSAAWVFLNRVSLLPEKYQG